MGISLYLVLPSDHTTFTRSHSDESAPFAKLWFPKRNPLTFLPRSSSEFATSEYSGSKQLYMDRLLKIFHLWVCSLYVISFTVRNWHGLYTNNLLNSYMVPSIITFTEAKFKTTTYYSTHFFIRLLLSALNRWRIS